MMRAVNKVGRGTALSTGVLSMMLMSSAALAQSSQAADESGDIIVTASKRGNETLQNTPASIGVMTAETLAKAGVVSFDDITKNVAGLNVINEGPGQNTIMIRGLVGAGEPTVGLYYDNLVTIGSGESAAASAGRQTDLVVFDTARVEVLRGPQSTLYGSSALAGVVRIISNEADPSASAGRIELEGAAVSHGSADWSIKGMVNVPLSDKAAIRVVGYRVHDGGYIDNVRLGINNFNKADQTGARISTKFLLGEDTTLTSQLYVQRLESNGAANARPWASTVGLTPYPAVGILKTDAEVRPEFNDTTILAGVNLEHRFDNMTLTLTQSYLKRKNTNLTDESGLGDFFGFLQSIDAFPNVPLPGTMAFRQKQDTELWNTEARIATDFDGPFNAVVGGFYQTRKSFIENTFADADPASGLVIAANPLWYNRNADFKLKQWAFFGEGTFKISDQFSLLAGIRYFQAKRHDISRSVVPFLRLGAPGAPDDVRSKENKAIFKFEADYKPTDNAMIYASASQGYRVGGTIIRVIPELPNAYGPDYTWNFELGAKTQWFDRKLTANLAVYQVNWYDTQISGEFFNGTFEGILNCKGLCARSRGVELEMTARPVHGLDLGFSGTAFKAKWTKDQPAINGSPTAGTQFAKTPTFSFSTTAGYKWDLSDTDSFELRADVQHGGKIAYTDYRPNFNIHTPGAYTLVNVSGTFAHDDRWSVKAYVRNLFDKRALFNVDISSSHPFSALVAQPRTVGLQFSASY